MEENLNQDAIDELIVKMKREVARQQKAGRIIVWAFILIIGLQVLLSIWPFKSVNLIMLFGIIPSFVYQIMNSGEREKAVAELTKREDVRLVGPLCDVLSFQNVGMSSMAEEALLKLLPHLKASDAPLLNMNQRKLLYGRLTGKNKPLVLAILKALEQIGDEKALPIVEKLAVAGGFKKNEIAIREAADACLPALRQRVQTLRVGQDLLRAAGPDIQPETLLRPAAATPETEPMQLLRASHHDAV